MNLEDLFKDKGRQLYIDIKEDIRLICLMITEKTEWLVGIKFENSLQNIEKPYFILYECKCIDFVDKCDTISYQKKKDLGSCGNYGIVLKIREFKILEKCKKYMNFEWNDIIDFNILKELYKAS